MSYRLLHFTYNIRHRTADLEHQKSRGIHILARGFGDAALWRKSAGLGVHTPYPRHCALWPKSRPLSTSITHPTSNINIQHKTSNAILAQRFGDAALWRRSIGLGVHFPCPQLCALSPKSRPLATSIKRQTSSTASSLQPRSPASPQLRWRLASGFSDSALRRSRPEGLGIVPRAHDVMPLADVTYPSQAAISHQVKPPAPQPRNPAAPQPRTSVILSSPL